MARIVVDRRKYPFLLGLDEALHVKYPGLRVEDVIGLRDSYPRRRALYLLKTIVSKGYVVEGSGTSEDEALVFYALLLGAKVLNDKKLLNRIAYAYSKHSSKNLSQEPLPVLVSIARRLGLEAELSSNPPKIPVRARRRSVEYVVKPVSIPVKQYLRLTAHRLAKDRKYSLVNQIVDRGRVFVDREVLARLLEELIFKRIVEIAEALEYDGEAVKDYVEEYKGVLEESRWFEKRGVETLDSQSTGYVPEALPPCMKMLIDKLSAGENLSHHERFTVAAFLANIGLDTDSILEFFKNTPDFNEKIARYQVEHIAGLRGSRKKYLPYNCDTMKSLGICPISDYCGKGRNPLVIYNINVRKHKKRKGGGE